MRQLAFVWFAGQQYNNHFVMLTRPLNGLIINDLDVVTGGGA